DMDGSVTFAVAFVAGVLSFLSPCVLPLVPSYLGFVTGMTLDDLRGGTSRWAILVPALAFTAGFSLVFLIMGATATLLGQMLLRYQDWISRIGGVLIILFGLHLLGVLRIMPFLRERRMQLESKPAGLIGAGVAGIVFGAGWTPCIGPVLAALLTYTSTRANLATGMMLLTFYSLGLAVPFLAAALATGSFLNTSKRMRRWLPVVEKTSGVILLIAGVLLVSGSFTVLSAYFARWTPEFLLEKL
ncbi:MAG TPA: cytochrome c biogenesis protein CcdA, partial [Longimicrobiales bacterium]|nr:cytochrome c biogenesis protein CcdA [Longimicrobiales bacterium]